MKSRERGGITSAGHDKGRNPALRIVGRLVLMISVLVIGVFWRYHRSNRIDVFNIPTHTVPADNAWNYYSRALAVSKMMKHRSPYDLANVSANGYTLQQFVDCAKDAGPTIQLFQEGIRHPSVYPAVRSVKSNVFSGFSGLRELERINLGVAGYYELTGQPGKAMETDLDGVEAGVKAPKGGGLLAGLVGAACEAIAESRLEPLLPRLSAAELKSSADRLNQIASERVSYADVLQEENYACTATEIELLRDPTMKTIGGVTTNLISNGDEITTWKTQARNWVSSVQFLLADKSIILRANYEWRQKFVEDARKPYHGTVKIKPPDNLLATLLEDGLDKGRFPFVARESALKVITTEVALYRYKLDRSRFPNSLSELIPTYLDAVPIDPCGGTQLHYRVAAGGNEFTLYSIGLDLKDNFGASGRSASDEVGDIVAGSISKKTHLIGKP